MNGGHRGLRGTMDRRRLLQAGAGGAAVAGLAGVAGGFARGGAARAQDTVALRFWVPPGSPKFCDVHQQIAQDYQAATPGVTFQEVQCLAGETDDYIQAILAAIAAGNPPDGMVIWDTPVSLGARDALLPLDDLMAASQHSQVEKWPAGLLASCQFNGVTYGLPVASGLYGLWYNADLLSKRRTTGTWCWTWATIASPR